MPVDNRVQRMIEELKEALAQAIRSSPAVTDAARKIRHQGFNLHLVLSFEHGSDEDPTSAESPSSRRALRGLDRAGSTIAPQPEETSPRADVDHRIELSNRDSQPWVSSRGTRRSRSDGSPAPVFRMNGHDVSILKSLGIDPTRRARGRRKPPVRNDD